MGKYGNENVEYEGMSFDSKRELKRWKELVLLQKAGKIRDLERQVKFELIPTQWATEKQYGARGKEIKPKVYAEEKAVSYYADFAYHTDTGEYVVEDAKGHRTQAYILKRKLMLYVHGIRIREV